MQITKSESAAVRASNEVVSVRHLVRRYAVDQGLNLIEQTKIVTAASELARNMLEYGGGGTMKIEAVEDGARKGVRLTFEDHGPGIADIEQALRDGFTTGGGMGLGLGGARRLSNEFDIHSKAGEGTRVTVVRWRGSI
ncbi:MAG: anti-sigma regulatory factor [Thermoanaerobaculia bacterium]